MAIAVFAILLGALQFLLPKGGLRHRIFGRIWSGLIITVCLSSLFIHETLPGAQRFMGYSPLHLFSLAVGLCLPTGLWAARQGKVALHQTMMLACFAGGGLAGALAFQWLGYYATVPIALLLAGLAAVPILDDLQAA
jgi:uncharacterized membrane protein